jgi:hypothetical protein
VTAAGTLLAVALAATATAAVAQDASDVAPDTVRELEAVRVTGRRPPADPFAFRNPVAVEETVFSRDWDEPPGLDEIGLRGGLVQMGINKGLELAGRGIRKLPGWKHQAIGAQARPPPLDADQRDRAMRIQAAGDVPVVASAASPSAPATDTTDAKGLMAAEAERGADPDVAAPRPR